MHPQRVGTGRALAWFRLGWQSFRAQPAAWIALFLLYVAVLLALNLVPVLGGLVGTLLAPALAGGLLLGAREGFAGNPVRPGLLFTGLTDARRRKRLLQLGGLGMGATLLLAGMYLGLADPGAPPDRVPAAGESGAGGLLVLLLALATGMAFFFATPLVMFTSAGPLSALAASLRGALGNLLPLLVFGVIYVVLAVAAAIPYGLGFLVLGPVGAGAAYASFAEVFPPAAESQGRRGETAFPA